MCGVKGCWLNSDYCMCRAVCSNFESKADKIKLDFSLWCYLTNTNI